MQRVAAYSEQHAYSDQHAQSRIQRATVCGIQLYAARRIERATRSMAHTGAYSDTRNAAYSRIERATRSIPHTASATRSTALCAILLYAASNTLNAAYSEQHAVLRSKACRLSSELAINTLYACIQPAE